MAVTCACSTKLRYYTREGVTYAGCLCGAVETRVTPVNRYRESSDVPDGMVVVKCKFCPLEFLAKKRGNGKVPSQCPDCRTQACRAATRAAQLRNKKTLNAECIPCGTWFKYVRRAGRRAPQICPDCKRAGYSKKPTKGLAADSSRTAA